MSFILRSLNEAGLEAFREYLARVRSGDNPPPPRELCSQPSTSDEVTPNVSIDLARTFPSRLEVGAYFEDVLEPIWSQRSIDADRGIWSALSLLYFDEVCPIIDGRRSVKNDDRYILLSSWDRVDRHLLRTPYVLTRIHGNNARIALSGKPYVFSEAVSQLTNRQQILTNVRLFEALDQLYMRPDGKLKRGASGKGAGSLRRLGKVIRQYDLTYDLHAMTAAEILTLLPHEFTAFKTASSTAS